jgi:enamine deaminase RidA (YjgF/YER057c/UK114 family)
VVSGPGSAATQCSISDSQRREKQHYLVVFLLSSKNVRHLRLVARLDGFIAAMSRHNISTGYPFEAKIGYSRAVVVDGWVMVSGTTGYVISHLPCSHSISGTKFTKGVVTNIASNRYNYDTGEISTDVAEQVEQILRNVDKALKEAGSCMADVVRVNYIVPDRDDFPKSWDILQKWFGNVKPAATMIQAPLMNEDMKFEIEVTAKIGCGKAKA